jgi:hypothetical protein
MSKTKFDNKFLPKRMNLILYTKTNQYNRKIYTPQMSIPTTTSSYVNFNPLIKINKDTFFEENKIKPTDKAPLNENIIDIFLNKQKFDELLNKIIINTNQKELTIKESCKEKVIDNNIKTTLDVLFKSGNVLEIDKKPYTVYNYTWLPGDWLIYSNDLKKENNEQYPLHRGINGYNRQHNYQNELTEQIVTQKAFDELGKEIPDCLMGDVDVSLLVSGDRDILQEQQKTDDIENDKKIFDEDKIDDFFKVNNDPFNLSENKLFLPFNLDYNVPSFLKDPISVSLFYLGYNYEKEITNYSSIQKYFDKLNKKKQQLDTLIKSIFRHTGSSQNSETIDTATTRLMKDQETITNNLNNLRYSKKELTSSLNQYTASKLVERNCERNLVEALDSLNALITGDNYTQQLRDQVDRIKTGLECHNSTTMRLQYRTSDIIKKFNDILKLIDEKIKIEEKKKNKDNDSYNTKYLLLLQSELLTLSNSDDVKEYIVKKKEYLNNCRETLELILKKIDMENEYLILFISFYKQLYYYKKSELTNTLFLSSDQKWLLTMVNQIILFDLIIYNTIYTSDLYQTKIKDTKKLINEYIEKIKTFQTIRPNVKDENVNKSKDMPILSSFTDIIYYTNYVVDMEFWKIFNEKTASMKKNFSTIVSKTIDNYHKLNESFSHASEYETQLKNMKYTCFDLINIYSRMTMISFLRTYMCDKYHREFYDQINKNIKEKTFDVKNKYYLDISTIQSYPEYNSRLDDAYLDYISSVKLLTPSITSGIIENMCNTLSTDGKEHDNDAFIREIGVYEFNQIKDKFNDQSFVQDFTSSGINNIKIIAYTNFKLSTAIKNGLNWYLYNEIKTLNGDYIDLDSFTEEDVLQLTQSTYKINICIIESNQEEAIAILKHSAITLSATTSELADELKKLAEESLKEADKIVTSDHTQIKNNATHLIGLANAAKPLATDAYNTTGNTTTLSSYAGALTKINNALESIEVAVRYVQFNFAFIPRLKKEADKLLNQINKEKTKKNNLSTIVDRYERLNRSPKLYFSEYNKLYDETLYLFKNGYDYYTILYNNPTPNPNTNPIQVCLLNKNDLLFQNVLIKEKKQRGGTKREQIESIMNQSLLNNLLQNPNAENDKRKILMNTLAYIVPIKLELYEGKDVPTNQKVSLKCEENYNNILKAWKVLFNIKEEKTSQAKPTPSF